MGSGPYRGSRSSESGNDHPRWVKNERQAAALARPNLTTSSTAVFRATLASFAPRRMRAAQLAGRGPVRPLAARPRRRVRRSVDAEHLAVLDDSAPAGRAMGAARAPLAGALALVRVGAGLPPVAGRRVATGHVPAAAHVVPPPAGGLAFGAGGGGGRRCRLARARAEDWRGGEQDEPRQAETDRQERSCSNGHGPDGTAGAR